MRRLGLIIVWIALAGGCTGITLPDGPAHEGRIVERDRTISFDQHRPTIWVKEDVAEECGVIYVIAPGTELVSRVPDGRLRAATVADLVVGALVRVWTDGVAYSCPGQATAHVVEILLAKLDYDAEVVIDGSQVRYTLFGTNNWGFDVRLH